MKIFDFNIHLTPSANSSVNEMILSENLMTDADLRKSVEKYSPLFKAELSGGNFMIFNQDIFVDNGRIDGFKSLLDETLPNYSLTMLFNYRRDDYLNIMDNAINQNVRGIKFHSYDQNIRNGDFDRILKICKFAEQKNLFICLDTSFGTGRMYDCDNLKLAIHLSESIKNTPIILLHSGGARVLEAMLLADDRKNIFLETSFSPIFYQESSLENDFAFAYKKIGCQRVLFGSDFPYIDLNKAINFTLNYLQKNNFSSGDIEDIMFNNATGLTEYV